MLGVIRFRTDNVPGKIADPRRAPQFFFNLGRNGGRGAPAEVSLDLETVEDGRIVAGRNHDAAGEFTPAHFKRYLKRGIRTIHQHHAKPVAGQYFGSRPGKVLRLKTHVEADENCGFCSFHGFEVIRSRLGSIPDIFEGKAIGNNTSPAVRAELDWKIHS